MPSSSPGPRPLRPADGKPRSRRSQPEPGGRSRPPGRASRRPARPLPATGPWGKEAKARFIELLSATGSLEGAIARMGRTRASAWVERAADPDFARAWDGALVSEYEVMEARLVSRALGVAEPATPSTASMRPEDLLVLWILSMRAPPPLPAEAPRARRLGPRRDAVPETPAPDPAAEVAADAARIDALIAEVAARVAAAEAAEAG